MRGILLAGGTGSRLFPLTVAVSKQLLPIHNKPMVYYPLSTLMLAGIFEILVITTPRDLDAYRSLLQDGKQFGISIEFAVQEKPLGLADGIRVGQDFIGNSAFALILGDNIFYGTGMGESLVDHSSISGATIFAQPVANPSDYGVVEFAADGKVLSIEEKPTSPKSSYAVPGLYFYDETAVERVGNLTPSPRGELEISDLNRSYLEDGTLQVVTLPRGTAWLDTGSIESLYQAGEFVRAIEDRQGLLISSPEEIAWRRGLITDEQLRNSANNLGRTRYAQFLLNLIS